MQTDMFLNPLHLGIDGAHFHHRGKRNLNAAQHFLLAGEPLVDRLHKYRLDIFLPNMLRGTLHIPVVLLLHRQITQR
jgi:hypothetical protein